MSFILDALKKSEAERRRGEVPGLQNEPFPPPPRRRRLWPLLLTLALLLNGLVLGWWLLSRDGQTATVAAVAVRPDQTVGAVDASPEPPRSPAATSAGRSAAPVEPSAATAALGESPAESASLQAGPVPAKTDETGVPSHRPEPPAASPARPRPAAAQVAESYPRVADLPGDVRAGLPRLDLQLHFFTPDAERRLVRLNGANLREGDRSGDGLSVVAITSDGVRLTCGGVRFFLPTGRR